MYADGDLAKEFFHTLGVEQNWTWPTERRSIWTENIMMFKVDESLGMEGAQKQGGGYIEAMLYQDHLIEKHRAGVSAFLMGPAADLSGPRWGPNSNVYIRKVKNLFDPQNLSDPFMNPAEAMPIAGAFNFAKKFLFKPAFRPLLRKLAQGMAKSKSSTLKS